MSDIDWTRYLHSSKKNWRLLVVDLGQQAKVAMDAGDDNTLGTLIDTLSEYAYEQVPEGYADLKAQAESMIAAIQGRALAQLNATMAEALAPLTGIPKAISEAIAKPDQAGDLLTLASLNDLLSAASGLANATRDLRQVLGDDDRDPADVKTKLAATMAALQAVSGQIDTAEG